MKQAPPANFIKKLYKYRWMNKNNSSYAKYSPIEMGIVVNAPKAFFTGIVRVGQVNKPKNKSRHRDKEKAEPAINFIITVYI